MTALNGKGRTVRFGDEDRHVVFDIDRLAMLEDYYGSFDAMTGLMEIKPVNTNRLVLLVAIGEIREADLDAQDDRDAKLKARIRGLSSKIQCTPGEMMKALTESLNDAMGRPAGAAADPTKAPTAPTPGTTS